MMIFSGNNLLRGTGFTGWDATRNADGTGTVNLYRDRSRQSAVQVVIPSKAMADVDFDVWAYIARRLREDHIIPPPPAEAPPAWTVIA